MSRTIYDQHDAAFPTVAAWVVLKGEEHVAKVALKYPSGNSLRLTAYVHWLGETMVRGSATGGGYDKASAACAAAAAKLSPTIGTPFEDFIRAMRLDGGASWDRALREAGFTVLQAV